MDWPTFAASVVGAALTGGGAVAVVNSLARRKVTKVEATAALNDSTLKWADKLLADADDARSDAAAARSEAAGARREAEGAREEMAAVRNEARALAWELRQLRLAIMDPNITLERLRAMVGDPPANGVARSPHGAF